METQIRGHSLYGYTSLLSDTLYSDNYLHETAIRRYHTVKPVFKDTLRREHPLLEILEYRPGLTDL